MMKKKTLRFTTIAGTLTLIAGMMAGCGSNAVSIDANALAHSLVSEISYSQDLDELSESEISNYIIIEDGVEAIMYMSSGSTAEEVAVFTAPDANTAATMKSNVEAFLDDQESSFEDYIPEEAKRIEDAVLEQNGNYVVLCVSGDSDKAEEIMNQAFGK
jgi:hypothetical protein